MYSGHSALGGNGAQSIDEAEAAQGKHPKLVFIANCRAPCMHTGGGGLSGDGDIRYHACIARLPVCTVRVAHACRSGFSRGCAVAHGMHIVQVFRFSESSPPVLRYAPWNLAGVFI